MAQLRAHLALPVSTRKESNAYLNTEVTRRGNRSTTIEKAGLSVQDKIIGVVGAGVMGTGLAQTLAQARFPVILVDSSTQQLQKAQANIRKSLRLTSLLQGRTLYEPISTILQRITLTTEVNALSSVSLVIENVPERWETKQTVYTQLDQVCPPDCIFAANTSAISITRLASLTQRPRQVIGTHFMNPVPSKPTVEVVRGYHTSEETLTFVRTFLAEIDKTGIVVNDMPGFVSNRVLMLMINEAIFLLQDQVAIKEDIDLIFTSCFSHQMGPLSTADLIGLDTILYSLEILYESYSDSKYRPCPLLKQMVAAGLYGRKNGEGFFCYS